MAGELEAVLRQMFEEFDNKRFDDFLQLFADDVQGVEEIELKWIRGRDGLAEYVHKIGPVIDNIHSEVSDVHEKITGDMGLLTCWIDQRYTMEEQPQNISCPGTVVFRREDAGWRGVLFHMIPLPEA
jgi:hypothetical protein